MGRQHSYRERKYDVGQRLLTLRTRARLTQTDLAGLIGVSRRSIQNWETGAAYPKEDGLQRLIEIFLKRGVFEPGHEREEAEKLWDQVNQDAPRRLASFDSAWFATLLSDHKDIEQSDPETRREAQAVSLSRPLPRSPLVDWGEAIDVPALYGRETELATLQQWVLADRCRVVALLGLGGIGKTSLAITFAQQAAAQFDAVLFRSLRNAPPLGPLLDGLIRAVSAQQATPPDSGPEKIALLVQLLRERRCLLVLDNLEAIIQAGAHVGDYRAGYADYGTFIQWMGEAAHQGCLLLTSREKPAELGPLEGRMAPVRTLTLTGLAEPACQAILGEKEVVGASAEYSALARLYGGNPLALKLVTEPIREIFGGKVGPFLASGDAFFNGVGDLLEQQYRRLAPLEQTILYWLAIERELTPLETLLADLTGFAAQREVLQALESLLRRLLIERGPGQPDFTLQPVIMEYLTDRLVGAVYQEIINGQPALLRIHALVQATAKDYIRRSQERLIAQPLLDQLIAAVGSAEEVERQLLGLLGVWRGRPHTEQGYGPGNVVNLLRLLRGNAQALDLSNLAIRQAYLQDVEAQDTNLKGSYLVQSAFIEAFGGVTSISLSADSEYLAAGTTDSEVQLWRVADRTPLLSLKAHTGSVQGVALSADGALLASGGYDGLVKLWEASSGHCMAILQGHTGMVWDVAVSADGRLVASCGQDGAIRVWDTASGECFQILEGHIGRVGRVALSADGALLASVGQDGTVRLWHTSSGDCLATLQGHTGEVWGVALSADGRLVASSGFDETVRLWDAASGECLATLRGPVGGVFFVALSPDGGRVASGGQDGTIRLWDTASGEQLTVWRAHMGQVTGVAISADTKLLLGCTADGMIWLWDVGSGQPLATLYGYTSRVHGVALSADGRLLANSSGDGTVHLWEPRSGQHLATLEGHNGRTWDVALSADGQLVASAGQDETIRLWDTGSGKNVNTLHAHTAGAFSVALSPDGRLLASGGQDGTVKLWDTPGGLLLATLEGHTGLVWRVALSGDGRLVASGGQDGTLRLWSTKSSGPALHTLLGHTGQINGVAFSADGRLVVSCGQDGTVRMWDTGSGANLGTLQGPGDVIWSVALSANGRILASGNQDATVKLRDISTRERLVTLQGHTDVVWGVAFSADAQLIASSSADGTVRLWDTRNGTPMRLLRPDRPYERMDITGLTGVTEAQRTALKALGAVEAVEGNLG